jgi:beta-glucosidase
LTFDIQPADLALWNPDMKHVVEPGSFTIYSGSNSVDLKSAKLNVTGSAPLALQDR